MSREPEKLLEELSVFIAESRKLVDKGAFVQLAGMDKQMRALCDEALKLSGEQRKQYASRLQKLFDEVKMLGDAMQSTRDAMFKEIQGLSGHRKANVAYQTTDSLDRRAKKTEE